MKRGPKGQTAGEMLAKGTFRPIRHAVTAELVAPDALPSQPDWLTEEGKQVWLDEIGRVSTSKGGGEVDSALFGNYCNLQGAIVKAWRSDTPPPVTALVEVRKMQEMLRIAGTGSRVKAVGNADKPTGNPFSCNGRR